MTSPGRYAADDGSFGKSAGSAAARGGVLIAVAVVIGLIILAVGFDGGDDSAADTTDSSDTTDTTAPTTSAPGDGSDSGDGGEETPTTSEGEGGEGSTTLPPTPSTRPPGEVKIAIGNGVGEPGLAGIAQEKLTTAGYVTDASNASAVPTAQTSIYYVDGYSADAAAVAAVLGSPADVIAAAPADPGSLVTSEVVDDFHVFVIQGEDRLAG